MEPDQRLMRNKNISKIASDHLISSPTPLTITELSIENLRPFCADDFSVKNGRSSWDETVSFISIDHNVNDHLINTDQKINNFNQKESEISQESDLFKFKNNSIYDTPTLKRLLDQKIQQNISEHKNITERSKRSVKNENKQNLSKIDFYFMHKDIPEIFMSRKERECKKRMENLMVNEKDVSNEDVKMLHKDVFIRDYNEFILRSPGDKLKEVSVGIKHSVTGKNGIVFYFKVTGEKKKEISQHNVNNKQTCSWFVYREMAVETSLTEIEKDLIDLKNAPRLLNNFINSFVVEECLERSQYLRYLNRIIEVKLFKNKMILVDSEKVISIENVKSKDETYFDHHKISIRYCISVSGHLFELSSIVERNAWMDELKEREMLK